MTFYFFLAYKIGKSPFKEISEPFLLSFVNI